MVRELQKQKETMAKMKSTFMYKQKIFEHDSNKKEKQISKLKDKLNAMFQQKDNERQMGMEIAKAVARRPDGKRRTWGCPERSGE